MPVSPVSPLDPAARVRYGRQIRLPEIGEAGQALLCATEVVLGAAGDARMVEASYLARAGIRVVDDVNAQSEAKAEAVADGSAKHHAALLAALGLQDSAARDVGDGAVRALLAVRHILGLAEEETAT